MTADSSKETVAGASGVSAFGVVADFKAPYARLAVVGLIRRVGGDGPDPAAEDPSPDGVADGLDTDPDPAAEGLGRGESAVRWLLLHRHAPVESWDPPGGRMERGEDLTTAVVREVAEETGLAVQVGGPCYALLTVYKGERLLAVSMACRVLGDADNVVLEPDGASEWRWASTEEWEGLALGGQSTWDADDVIKATRMATALWEAGER